MKIKVTIVEVFLRGWKEGLKRKENMKCIFSFSFIISQLPSIPEEKSMTFVRVPNVQSYIPQHTGFDQKRPKVQIQNTNSKSTLSTEGLVRVSECIPPEYSQIIPYEYLNRIQSVVCKAILQSNDNIVISAPTVRFE